VPLKKEPIPNDDFHAATNRKRFLFLAYNRICPAHHRRFPGLTPSSEWPSRQDARTAIPQSPLLAVRKQPELLRLDSIHINVGDTTDLFYETGLPDVLKIVEVPTPETWSRGSPVTTLPDEGDGDGSRRAAQAAGYAPHFFGQWKKPKKCGETHRSPLPSGNSLGEGGEFASLRKRWRQCDLPEARGLR